jgi:hypothetical protein
MTALYVHSNLDFSERITGGVCISDEQVYPRGVAEDTTNVHIRENFVKTALRTLISVGKPGNFGTVSGLDALRRTARFSETGSAEKAEQ